MSTQKAETLVCIAARHEGFSSSKTVKGLKMYKENTTQPSMPRMPSVGTHAHRALAALVEAGDRGLTHPEYEARQGSWRLASAVHALRRLRWGIRGERVRAHGRRCVRYYLVGGEHV